MYRAKSMDFSGLLSKWQTTDDSKGSGGKKNDVPSKGTGGFRNVPFTGKSTKDLRDKWQSRDNNTNDGGRGGLYGVKASNLGNGNKFKSSKDIRDSGNKYKDIKFKSTTDLSKRDDEEETFFSGSLRKANTQRTYSNQERLNGDTHGNGHLKMSTQRSLEISSRSRLNTTDSEEELDLSRLNGNISQRRGSHLKLDVGQTTESGTESDISEGSFKKAEIRTRRIDRVEQSVPIERMRPKEYGIVNSTKRTESWLNDNEKNASSRVSRNFKTGVHIPKEKRIEISEAKIENSSIEIQLQNNRPSHKEIERTFQIPMQEVKPDFISGLNESKIDRVELFTQVKPNTIEIKNLAKDKDTKENNHVPETKLRNHDDAKRNVTEFKRNDLRKTNSVPLATKEQSNPIAVGLAGLKPVRKRSEGDDGNKKIDTASYRKNSASQEHSSRFAVGLAALRSKANDFDNPGYGASKSQNKYTSQISNTRTGSARSFWRDQAKDEKATLNHTKQRKPSSTGVSEDSDASSVDNVDSNTSTDGSTGFSNTLREGSTSCKKRPDLYSGESDDASTTSTLSVETRSLDNEVRNLMEREPSSPDAEPNVSDGNAIKSEEAKKRGNSSASESDHIVGLEQLMDQNGVLAKLTALMEKTAGKLLDFHPYFHGEINHLLLFI